MNEARAPGLGTRSFAATSPTSHSTTDALRANLQKADYTEYGENGVSRRCGEVAEQGSTLSYSQVLGLFLMRSIGSSPRGLL